MRNAGGNLYFATSSPSTFATSTITALTIDQDGDIGIGSTSPYAKLSIDAGTTGNTEAIYAKGSIDNFFEINVQNTSTGVGAQSGFSATMDTGTLTTNFMWMGINNSNFYNPQTYNIGGAGDANILALGNDMYLANGSSGKNLYFVTGGTSTSTNTRMTIDSTGQVGIGTKTPGALLTVNGTASTSALIISSLGVPAGTFLAVSPTGAVIATTSPTGGGYATIQDEGSNLTARTKLNFIGTGVSCADNGGTSATDCTINAGAASAAGSAGSIQFNTANALDGTSDFTYSKTNSRLGIGTTTPWAGVLSASTTSGTTTPAVVIDQRGAGGLLTLQQGGVDKFVVANSGGLTINTQTTDIVKTTSSSTPATDFLATGATLATTTSTNNYVTIQDGVVNDGIGTVSATSTVTAANVSSGGQVIIRSDGKYLIIHGGGSATASLWNGFNSGTMSTQSVVSTGSVGAGSIAIRRADGRYLLVHGGAVTNTSVFDPFNITTVAAGPSLTSAAATGTYAFQRSDGKYVILSGGTPNWGIYDPAAATASGFASGTPATGGAVGPTGAWGAGAHALQRDDGTFLIYQGGGSTNTWIYNPYSNFILVGPAAPTAITSGAFSIRRQDGYFLTLPGAANQSFSYNPVATTSNGFGAFSANYGVGPSAALADSAQATWRQDGKYVLISSSTTSIIDTGAGSIAPSFTSGPSGFGTLGHGLTVFMLPDGRYAVVRGGASTAIDIYDMNFVTGIDKGNTQNAYYESECISNTNITPNSTLNWTSNAEGKIYAYARTATSPADCSQSTYVPIAQTGSLIGATSTADNRIQFKFVFQRELPRFLDQEWGIRKSGLTRYRRVNADPVLYDVTVDNGAVLHKTQFDFGNSVSSTTASASGPVYVNISNDTNRQNALALSTNSALGSTVNGTNPIQYNGAFAVGPQLPVGTASTTIVMKRPDGTFKIISGSTTLNSMTYDEKTGTTTLYTSAPNVPTQALGTGGFAVKRPDGKFLIVMGGGWYSPISGASNGPAGTSTTNIYDPVLDTFTAGPNLASINGSTGAGMGASAIPLPNGRILIMHGGFTANSSIYDPVNNTMAPGPTTSAAILVGGGSLWIPRPDGTYLFLPGYAASSCATAITTTLNFDPYTMTFTSVGSPAQITPGTGPGAFAFQRRDGLWVIVKGGSAVGCIGAATTQIYNPVSNATMIAGAVPGSAAGMGAHALPRPDGTWLIIYGGGAANGAGQSTTGIYNEQAGAAIGAGFQGQTIGAFTAGPVLANSATSNSGAISFQRSDGKFMVILGAATTTTTNAGNATQIYDAGWVASGIYRSEQFDLSPAGTKLDQNSTLVWKSNVASVAQGGISVEVKTAPTQAALGTTTAREISNSGGLINPSAGDAWMQVIFNFRRSFPSYGGIYTDVWNNNGGSAMNYPQRPVLTPVLYEYKVTKDKDLLNLQSDGLSMFRVSSAGDIYAQQGGTINTSGADLAERYTSQEQLDFGEVVSIDPQNNHGVKKTGYQYQPDALGVVSTDPGFVAGAYTENSYPIALIGRVPVKVSTENGMIRVGDKLTAASVPGHAMKATLAGHIIGHALESLDPQKLTDCPASDIYLPNRKCGTIMMFVNLSDYMGAPVDDVMSAYNDMRGINLDPNASGLVTDTTSQYAGTIGIISGTKEAKTLAFLENLRKDREAGPTYKSDIFADKISAVSQVISPNVVTNLLNAKDIEGLKVNAGEIKAGQLQVDSIIGGFVIRKAGFVANALSGLGTTSSSTDISVGTTTPIVVTNVATSTGSTTPFAINLDDGVVVTFDTTGNAVFAGDILSNSVRTNGLEVHGTTTLVGGLRVDSIGTASTTIAMLSDVEFFGRPYFTSDMGGTAVVQKGSRSVDVIFDREYLSQPTVSATIALESSTTTDTKVLEQAIFDADVRYLVTQKSTHGFTILLNNPAKEDITFSWIALAIKDGKISLTSNYQPLSTIQSTSTATTTNPQQVNPVPPVSTSTQPVVPPDTTTPPDSTASSTPVTNDPTTVTQVPDTTTSPAPQTTDTSTTPVPTPVDTSGQTAVNIDTTLPATP
jgi:hypothetical protein